MDKNEMVVIDMGIEPRLRLSNQVYKAMEARGYLPYDYDKLELGFKLPLGWPADKDAGLTLAQLVVVALKLNMLIVIGDVNLIEMTEKNFDRITG